MQALDATTLGLLAGTAVLLVAAVWLDGAGMPVAWCLLVVTLAPAVTVVGYEALGPPPPRRDCCRRQR